MDITYLHKTCGMRRLVYHFAWGPMREKPLLVGEAAQRLRDLLCEKAGCLGLGLLALQIRPACVYMAVDAPPTLSPHQIMCGLKAYTSGVLRREFKEMTTIPTLWTREYLVIAGEGVTPEIVLEIYAGTVSPRRPRGRPRLSRE